jgi:hypothetical protein
MRQKSVIGPALPGGTLLEEELLRLLRERSLTEARAAGSLRVVGRTHELLVAAGFLASVPERQRDSRRVNRVGATHI